MIPAFTLGIPGEAGAAVLLGALMIQGMTPGPQLLQGDNSKLMYTIFASFFVANIGILLWGLLGARFLVKIVSVPPKVLVPIIALLCLVGSYALNYRLFDVWITVVFGIIGYFFIRHDFPVSPIILGMILGPMAEANLRRSLTANGGDWTVFFTRPISLLFWALIVLSLFYVWRSNKKAAQVANTSQVAQKTTIDEVPESPTEAALTAAVTEERSS